MPSRLRLPAVTSLLALSALTLAALPHRAAPAAPATPAPAAEAPADGLLVAFRPQATQAQRVAAAARLGLELDPNLKNPFFVRLRVPGYLTAAVAVAENAAPAFHANAAEARREFIRQRIGKAQGLARLEAAVRVAQPDYICTTDAIPNDPSFSSLWALQNTGQAGGVLDADVDATEAWDRTVGSDQVIVAVIDTGVDYNHPDLRENILRDGSGQVVGYDYVNNDADPMDDRGHGTHCAGTIGARGNNGIGITGVAQRVKLMPLKFMGADGRGDQSDAIQAIDFARTRGAKVMSNSWGSSGASPLLHEAIQRARDAGILFVAAAGNDNRNTDSTANFPSYYTTTLSNVVSVGATTPGDDRASFSNYGTSTVDLGAPGLSIYSTWIGGGYAVLNGTSMATPHVAGAAALALAANPQLTPAQLKERLTATTDRPAALNGVFRTGRLNVATLLGPSAPSVPAAPTGLAATAGNARVDLTWSAVNGAASYTVKRSAAASGPFTAVTSGLSVATFADTAVVNGTTYFYQVTAANTTGESAPSNTVSATPTAPVTPPTGGIRVNAGGAAYTAADGTQWLADQYFTGGWTYATHQSISGTTDPLLYRSERYGNQTYRLPAADGVYTLKLHFAEIYANGPGQRLFNVAVNGQQVLAGLDIFAEAGGNYRPLVKSFTGQASGGYVTVSLASVRGDGKLSALELLSNGGGSTPTVPAAPTGLTATAGNAQVDLAWSFVTGATSYSIKRSTASAGPFSAVASGLTATTYADIAVSNGTPYFYQVTASNAAGESAPSSTVSATPTAPVTPPTGGIRVNAGGAAYTAADGTQWLADQYFTGGWTYATYQSISGSTDPTLYRSERYGNVTYRLPAADGSYTLKLHFAEIYANGPGQRIFNVAVNGQQVLSSIDIFAEAGGNYRPLVKSFTAQASGGYVTVSLTGVRGDGKLSGLELLPAQ